MKIVKILFAFALTLLVSNLYSQAAFTVKSADMTIKGTSSLHDWTSTVGEVNAKGKIDLTGGQLKGISELTVTVTVASIKSTKGKVMDNKTHEALKMETNPTITYQLTEVKSIEKTAAGFQIKARGKLTIAGETRTIDLTVDSKVLPDGAVQFSGSKALKMTDFNMSPPTALLGTLKTGDDVTIVFSVTLAGTRS